MEKVFVNSVPKAGTNLLSKCLELFGYRQIGHIGAGGVLENGLRGRVRRIVHIPVTRGYLVGINSPVEISRRGVDRLLAKSRCGEFLTAHVGYTEYLQSQ